MAGGVDFTYTVGLEARTDQLTKKIDSFNKEIGGRSIELNVDLAGFDQGKTKKAFDSLGVSLDNIKKVTSETITMTNAQGKSYEEVSKYVVQYTNAMGKLTTATINIDNQTKTAIAQSKRYDDTLKSTEKTLNSTQNVEAKHRDAIVATANALNSSISEWKELASTHQLASPRAKELETKIQSLTTTLKQQEGATKTGAAGLQNWASTAERVIKQSFAYAIAMRAIRSAQQEFNKALKFTIDLNTEMTKIQVLQVEGAKTAGEIDNLASSFNRLAQEMGSSTLEVARGSVEWFN